MTTMMIVIGKCIRNALTYFFSVILLWKVSKMGGNDRQVFGAKRYRTFFYFYFLLSKIAKKPPKKAQKTPKNGKTPKNDVFLVFK